MAAEGWRMLRAYGAFMRAHARRLLEYRSSFFIGIVAVLTRHIVGVLTLWVIFTQVEALGGWNPFQVVYLYGFVTLVTALHHFFFMNTFRLEFMVQHATLDRYLVRPLPTLFQVMLYYMDDDALGDLVPAVLLLYVASAELSLAYTLYTSLVLVLGVLGGVAIFFGIHLTLACWSFWFIKSRALITLFAECRRFSEYPLRIFNQPLQVLLTFVVPLGFAAYYPTGAILEAETLGVMAWLSLPVGVVSIAVGLTVWHVGLRHYQSTGS